MKNLFLSAAVFSAVFLAGGCGFESGSGATKAAAVSPAADADPEIDSALKLIEKMPDSPSGYMQLAIRHIRRARETGDFSLNSKAEAAIDEALKIAPTNVPARKVRGSLLLTFHRFDEALQFGTELQKELPNDPFVYGILTDANFELGNYEEAVKTAQKMVDIRPNSISYARVAHLRSFYGDHAGAVEMYTTAARITDPKDREAQAWCLVQLGDEYFKYGKLEDAEKIYDEALTILPDFHMAVAAKGKVRAAAGDLEGAEKTLTALLGRVPNVDSAILLGDIYAKQGSAEKASAQYELAELMERKIGVNTDQKRLARLWADQNTRLDEALEIVVREQAARKDIYTEDTLAWCLYRKGRFAEAREAAQRAMRLKSNDALIMYHTGMIEKALGNKAEATRLLRSALSTNPSFDLLAAPAAQTALAELTGGRS